MERKIKELPRTLLHGGDYNPDQWLDRPDILAEDIRLMKEAHVNCASLGIFAWSKLEPEEGVYDLDWLGEIIDRLYENGIYTILATPTAALPHWMSEKYVEVRQMLSNGLRKYPGERHNFCASSPVMREKMRGINSALSRRFGQHPGVIAWHISNEYAGCGGDHMDGACYCPLCQEHFREWLKKRYGTLDNLNHAWWTGFWSNTFTDWKQIHAPSAMGENRLHGLKLDWKRFTSDQLLDFCKEEIAAVRQYSDRPAVTNFMGMFYPLNYFKWAKTLDLVSYDNYQPWHATEDDVPTAMYASMGHTLTRSLKKQPFLLMESTPSLVSWMPKCSLMRPGMQALSSLQAVACGSDSVQYFQWRKSRGSCEKYHGAVVDHKNGGNTRVFRDVASLGERLKKIAPSVLGTCNQPKAAIVFDWENWWAVEGAEAVTNPFGYDRRWLPFYQAFWRLGIDVDIVDMEDPLEGYSLVVAPYNYMYRGNYIETVKDYVAKGGTYVTTCWSGEVDDSDLCFLDRHPLGDVLGIRTEEIDVSPAYVHNQISWQGKDYAIRELCALVHAETAEVLGVYEKDFYAGYPALTKNNYGEGEAYFIASENDDAFLLDFLGYLAERTGSGSSLRVNGELPYGVTVNERRPVESSASGEVASAETEKGSLWFVQNFNSGSATMDFAERYRDIETGEIIEGKKELTGYQCLILEQA